VQKALRDMSGKQSGWISIGDLLMNTYMALDRRAKDEEKAILTGSRGLDHLTGGFMPGELTILGARPSIGKTSAAIHATMTAAKSGFRVGVCSCEMSQEPIGQRIFSRETPIDGMKLRTGQIEEDEWTQLSETMVVTSSLPIHFLHKCRKVEDLRREVSRLMDTEGMDMLVVDYLQLMQTRQYYKDNHLRVGYITKELRNIATDFKIPVLVCAQVGRSAQGSMPTLNELRDSGEIEQDADSVIFIHRAQSADDSTVLSADAPYFDTLTEGGKRYVVFGVAKMRQGKIGSTSMIYDPALMRYYDIDRKREGA